MQRVAERGITRAQMGMVQRYASHQSLGLPAAQAAQAAESEDNLSDIVVTGHPSIGVYATTLQDTAQNVTVIPQQVLADQAVNNLQDALKNVPGVTLNAGEGGTHGDNINLRGFAASDDFFLDGLRDTGFYTRDSFNIEGIEVYKGPASTLFGRGSTGGVVNQVSKAPQLEDFARGTIAGGTNSELRGTADLNYALGDSSAVRVNAMGQKSSVADRDFVNNRRWGVAPLPDPGDRQADDLDGRIFSSGTERRSRLWHPVCLRQSGARTAKHLLWVAER